MKKYAVPHFSSPFSKGYLKSAASHLGNVRSMVTAALLCAVAIVLERFNLHLSDSLQVSLSFIPIMLCSALTGPLFAIPCGIIVDVIGFVIGGYAFMPGYTLTAVLTAMSYALFLYGSRMSLMRLAMSKLFVNVFINTVLGSVWRVYYYGHPFFFAAATSGMKNLLLFPAEVLVISVFFGAVGKPLTAMGYLSYTPEKPKLSKLDAVLLSVFALIAIAATVLLAVYYNDIKEAFKFLK